jgi:hypothetical protein
MKKKICQPSKAPVIKVEKATGRAACRGHTCPKNKEYVTDTGKVVKGTMCAAITVQTSTALGCLYQYFYCRDCIDWFFSEMNTTLDPKNWIIE